MKRASVTLVTESLHQGDVRRVARTVTKEVKATPNALLVLPDPPSNPTLTLQPLRPAQTLVFVEPMPSIIPTRIVASARRGMAEMPQTTMLDAVLVDRVPSRARWETRNARPAPLDLPLGVVR